MSETVLVLRASKWEMTDEKTGEIRQGNLVFYLAADQTETPTAVGEQSIKASASDEVFAVIKKGKAPGFYNVITRLRPTKDGTAKVMLTQAKHIAPLAFPKP